MQASHAEHCPEIGPICAERDEPPQRHEQSILLGELRLRAELAPADGWGISLLAPLRLYSTTIRYTDLDGNTVHLDYENIHHRNETLVGPGDPWLLGRKSFAAGVLSGSLQAGVSLPLGRTEENPFRLGEEGRSHQHSQFGTGTFDPIAALDARIALSGWSLGAFAIGRLVVYENGKGYQAGNRYGTGLFAASGLGLTRWSFHLGPELNVEAAERWDGQVMESDGNRGRVDFLAAAGASVDLGAGFRLTSTLRVPLYTHVVGGQLEYPLVAELGLSGDQNLWGGAEEHHHHHHDHHDHHDHAAQPDAAVAGLDIASIADHGEDVALVPVPGRITIFDFWATWCVPCHELDRLVADLMRRHPGRLAVRKLDVETWDRPAARHWLSDAPSLPHLRVHRADGSLAFARSGSPQELLAAIEALLPQ